MIITTTHYCSLANQLYNFPQNPIPSPLKSSCNNKGLVLYFQTIATRTHIYNMHFSSSCVWEDGVCWCVCLVL